MKVFFISTIYKEEEKEDIKRVKEEIKKLGFEDYRIYVHDGIADNRGYAYGINRGIEKGLKEGADLFVVFNADISFGQLNKKVIIDGLKDYDILGFALEQERKIYYGGAIDRWRLSGGLIDKKPEKRYVDVDFVSGSLMIVKRKVVEKLGLFDESYFLYYEEVDYCYQAERLGFKVGIDSSHFYKHFERSRFFPKKEYFLAKSRWRFFWRYSNLLQKIREFFRLPKTMIESLPLFFFLFLKSKFLTNLFSLNFSSLLNKFFHFVLFIFLVRNLSPDKYGVYIIVWTFIGIFTPLLDLGTTNYGLVYLPKERKAMMSNLIAMRFYFAGVIFLIANLSAWFFFRKQPEMIIYIVLTSVSILASVWSGSYLIINSVREKIIFSSIVSLLFTGSYVLAIIISLLLKKELLTIFLIISLSFLLYALINFWLVRKEIPQLRLPFTPAVWKRILTKSYLFVLISFISGIYFKHNVFLLKYFHSESDVGIYSSGFKFLDASLLLAASYNITVMPIFSRIAKEKHLLKKKIKKDFFLLTAIGFLTAILFYFLGPFLLPLILKGNYLSGIKVAQIVVFALPLILIGSIFYNVLYVFEMANYVFFIFLIRGVVNLILNIVFIPVYSYFACAWLTVLTEFFSTLLAFYFVRKKLDYENFP